MGLLQAFLPICFRGTEVSGLIVLVGLFVYAVKGVGIICNKRCCFGCLFGGV